jgi:hypothetical protein
METPKISEICRKINEILFPQITQIDAENCYYCVGQA